jgi:hypothetical protein
VFTDNTFVYPFHAEAANFGLVLALVVVSVFMLVLLANVFLSIILLIGTIQVRQKWKLELGIFTRVSIDLRFVLCNVTSQFLESLNIFHVEFQRNYWKCRTWFNVTIVLLVLYGLNSGSSVFSHETQMRGRVGLVSTVTSFVVGILVWIFELWVVYAFMQELKEDRRRILAERLSRAPSKVITDP